MKVFDFDFSNLVIVHSVGLALKICEPSIKLPKYVKNYLKMRGVILGRLWGEELFIRVGRAKLKNPPKSPKISKRTR